MFGSFMEPFNYDTVHKKLSPSLCSNADYCSVHFICSVHCTRTPFDVVTITGTVNHHRRMEDNGLVGWPPALAPAEGELTKTGH